MIPAHVVDCLRLVERRDGLLRVAGIHDAYMAAGINPRDYMDDRRSDVREFADELRDLSRRLLMLAEVAA